MARNPKQAPIATDAGTEVEQLEGAKVTPLMKQYHAIKAKYPGALLLFRVGDFYETFGDDAVTAAGILHITLTKRANGAASEVALAGFPHHALDNYLPKLVKAGQRVAICDQLEDPKFAQGIVKRGVTELVTPGVVLSDHVLETRRNNFLAAVHYSGTGYGLALLDLSTGEFYVAQGAADYIEKLLQSFQASEVLYAKPQKAHFFATFGDGFNTFGLDDWTFQYDFAHEKLTTHFNTLNLKGFGIAEQQLGIVAAGVILHYLAETEHKHLSHIASISRIEADRYVWLDRFTIRNLELLQPQQEQGIPLLQILDETQTPMGARLLRNWVVLPLKDVNHIQERLDMVEALRIQTELQFELRQYLKQVGDLERIISKVAARRINPREMLALKRALKQIGPIKALLEQSGKEALHKIADQLNPCKLLLEKIENTLLDEVPLNAAQGNLIRSGIHAELDELRGISGTGKDFLLQIQQREIERTGISSLKISYNKVFGYYLEVTNSHKEKVPTDWIRKQTLVNAERYITEELKNYEEKILNAEGNMLQIEQTLYLQLVDFALDYIQPVQLTSRHLAVLDCLAGFAAMADVRNYVMPKLSKGTALNIENGRHPVIEQQLPHGEVYVPNDTLLDTTDQQIIIITGPNMAGKSALLRQTALIVLMAQIGCFVPAKAAEIGIVDKIFTRVGASDNLSKGESTFMVEMTETASIINNLSERSLILMDEIGRGTSTYDGVSIAWSIVEYLHNHPKYKARTLFATHYHELNELAKELPRVRNFNVSVKQVGGKVVFLRKLKAGGSEHSFGIHVAQMAGMPNGVVLRANEIMKHLEKEHGAATRKEKVKDMPKANYQLSFFEPINPALHKAQEIIKGLDINSLSPMEALIKLNEIKLLLEKENLQTTK
jgi:DNA mismatch repair protein MutS